MERRSIRKWWLTLGVLLLMARSAIAAPAISDLEERVLQAIARHADREAATMLVETWQQAAGSAVSPASVALNEGLKGHYLTAKQLMTRVVADNPNDRTARLGSLVLILLEGNPPAGRTALEELAVQFPENPHLQRRYSDVLESMGLPSAALPRPEEPTEPEELPVSEPAVPEPGDTAVPATPTPEPPKPAPTTTPREIRPVQAESVREQLLRQLAEAQTRQAREEAERLRKAREEQARKRREEAARVEAEKKRREEAVRLAAEQKRQQEQARQAAQRQKAEQARLASEQRAAEARAAAIKQADQKKAAQARQAEAEQAKRARLEQARLAAEQKKRLERAEQERWLAARRNQPSVDTVRPPVIPTPPPVEAATYVLKPVTIANRRVWIGEERASVQARLGRPRSVESGGLERYAGLSVWYDRSGKVVTFEVDSAWYHGPGGVRPGLTLREVLRALPNSDGLFHLPASGPDATSSLYVLSTVDGTLAELQFNDEVWLATNVRTTTPAAATHLYEDLLQKGPVRRLAPDYVFALEARRKPLP